MTLPTPNVPNLANLTGVNLATALFEHGARLLPLANAYRRQQLSLMHSGNHPAYLSQYAKACLLVARKMEQGYHPEQVIARLSRHPGYHQAAEIIARAYLNQQVIEQYELAIEQAEESASDELLPKLKLPFAIHDDSKPMPASLVRGLLKWPEQDSLLGKIIAMLEQQPALSEAICRYATAYTPQGKTLGLKQSLLLTGPERSRELLLLSHFESNLSRPQFPLRRGVLARRQLIAHVMHRLCEQYQVQLPCRVELLSWLVVYDAWRHPSWTGQRQWRRNGQIKPWQLGRWLHTSKPYSHRVAARLCQYWQLDKKLLKLLNLNAINNPAQAILALSIASIEWLELLNGGAAKHQHLLTELSPAFAQLSPAGEEPTLAAQESYHQVVHQAAWASGYHCPIGEL